MGLTVRLKNMAAEEEANGNSEFAAGVKYAFLQAEADVSEALRVTASTWEEFLSGKINSFVVLDRMLRVSNLLE